MIELITIIIIFFIGTWFDIKFKVIPNKILYFGFLGICIQILVGSVFFEDFNRIYSALIGLAIGLIIAFVLFEFKILGGADCKMIIILSTCFERMFQFMFFQYIEINLIMIVFAIFFLNITYIGFSIFIGSIFAKVENVERFAFFPVLALSYFLIIILL